MYRTTEELECTTKKTKELKKKKKKISTVMVTAELVKQEKTLDEMIAIRELTAGTLIGHLCKIRIQYPEIDMSYLKPTDLSIERVQEMVDILVEDEENFTEKGELSLGALYHALNEEIVYDELKRCMVFVNI